MSLARTRFRRKGKTTEDTSAPATSADNAGPAVQVQHMPAYAHAQDKPAVPLLGGLAQAKLAICQDNDPSEVEADAVAAEVTSETSSESDAVSEVHSEALEET